MMSKTIQHTGLIDQLQAGSVSVATLTGVTLAIAFGVFLILGTGFAGAEILHNAAHDVRHG